MYEPIEVCLAGFVVEVGHLDSFIADTNSVIGTMPITE